MTSGHLMQNESNAESFFRSVYITFVLFTPVFKSLNCLNFEWSQSLGHNVKFFISNGPIL